MSWIGGVFFLTGMKPYFSHDEGARNDPKLIKVLMRLGQAGKGVYWDLVEMLYEQNGYLLLEDCESHAFALRTDCGLILKLVNDFDLFTSDGTRFWSETCLERMGMRDAKKLARAEAGAKGGKIKAEREAVAKALLEHDHSNASQNPSIARALLPEILAIKEKEIKEGKPSMSDSATPSPDGAGFEVFWNEYGRKEGAKSKMAKQWNGLKLATRQTILNGLSTYKQAKMVNGPQFLPMPQTFLNGKLWEAETYGLALANGVPARLIAQMPDDPCSLWGTPNPDYDHRTFNQPAGQYAGTIQ